MLASGVSPGWLRRPLQIPSNSRAGAAGHRETPETYRGSAVRLSKNTGRVSPPSSLTA